MQYHIFSSKSRESVSGPYTNEKTATSMIPTVAAELNVDKNTLYVANEEKKASGITIYPKPVGNRMDWQRKAEEMGVKYIPPLPDPEPVKNPVVAICGQCGRECYQTEMFSCPEARCPVQKKGRM